MKAKRTIALDLELAKCGMTTVEGVAEIEKDKYDDGPPAHRKWVGVEMHLVEYQLTLDHGNVLNAISRALSNRRRRATSGALTVKILSDNVTSSEPVGWGD